jgi:hypothetical protein
MGKKVFIALLIVIGVLFLVFVGVGTRDRDGNASAPPGGVLGALMKRAQGQSAVPLSDLKADCLKPGGVLTVQFPVQSLCKLNVAAGGDGLRTVHLTLTQGKVTVSAPLPDPKGGSTSNLVSTTLPSDQGGKDINVAVGNDAVVISLTCVSGCRLLVGG